MTLFNRILGSRRSAVSETSPIIQELSRWERLLKRDPDGLNARLRIIHLLGELDRAEEMRHHLEEVEHRHPDARPVRMVVGRQKVRMEAEDALEHWLENERRWSDDIETTGRVASLLINSGRFDEALVRVEALESSEPDRAAQLRVRALIRAERNEEALVAMRAMASDGELELFEIVDMARLVELVGDPDEALTLVQEALERFGFKPRLVLFAVRLLERGGRRGEALALLDEGDVATSSYEARVRRIGLLISLGRYEEADADCCRALELHPDDIQLLTLHARSAQTGFGASRAA